MSSCDLSAAEHTWVSLSVKNICGGESSAESMLNNEVFWKMAAHVESPNKKLHMYANTLFTGVGSGKSSCKEECGEKWDLPSFPGGPIQPSPNRLQ